MKRLGAAVLCILPACSPAYAAQGANAAGDPCEAYVATPPAIDSARTILLEVMAHERVPGSSVAAVRDGVLIWSEGFGRADIAGDRPVCRSTQFRLGSVSKVLTGAALLRLRDAGVVELETDVRALVPQVSWQPVPITLRQLAGHLGGIRHYAQSEYFNGRRYEHVSDAFGTFAGDSLRSPPGAAYHYSSYGYNLLGAALEAAADTPYAALVRATVLETLGVAHTSPESNATAGAMATPHIVEGGRLVTATEFDPSDRLPSGGWVASAEDVARLGAALLDPGFLSDESRAVMFSSQRTSDGRPTGYSVGLRIATDSAGRLIAHHGGASVGARAFLLLYPAERLSVAVLANGPARFDEDDVARLAAPLLVPSSSARRADAVATAMEYALLESGAVRGQSIVVDTARTDPEAAQRTEMMETVTSRIGATSGFIEDYCFRIPPEHGLRQMEVRGADAVLAAKIRELQASHAVIDVTVWRGSGFHTGGVYTLRLQRDAAGAWVVAEHMFTATTGCIPGS